MKKYSLPILLTLMSLKGFAQEQSKDSTATLNEVVVNNKYKYKREKSTTVSKMPLRNIENPQVYNTVTAELMKEQVITNFNDALKNATGVTRLWESTGRGGDGAEFYSIRGFSVQPTMINGLPGISNGVVDPINIDNIEVIKGPSGTLFGSSFISYGGLINIVTKRPHDKFGGEIGYTSGTFGMDRITLDVNTPLKNGLNVRINAAYTNENSFQDAGFTKSLFVAPSLSYKVNDRLTFLVNTEFTQKNGAYAPMVFLNRYTPLSFTDMAVFDKNFRKSYTSNELTMSNPTFNMQTQMLYKLDKNWTSQTALSRSNTKTDGYYSYLWDSGNGNEFTRFISKRNGSTNVTDIQQNFIGDFKMGTIRNRMVIGLDYARQDILNSSSGWRANGIVSLQNQTDSGDLTQAGTDALLVGSFEGASTATQQILSAYVSDVINFTPKLSVMASLRIDNFSGLTSYYSTEKIKDQTTLSPKFGAVYQLIENKVSVFGNYMNGFAYVDPRQVADADGSNSRLQTFDPEHANQYEFGLKTNLYKDILSASLSYYNIKVNNRVMGDPNNINGAIQGGEMVSKGLDFSVTLNPIKGLNIITGYSYNDAEITKDNPDDGYLGLRPEESGPQNLANLWASYTLNQGKWKGLGFGFGGNYASEYKTLNRANIGTFTLPEYTVLNSSISYSTGAFNLIIKVNNLTNEKYYSGWSTVTPQRMRSLNAGITYKF